METEADKIKKIIDERDQLKKDLDFFKTLVVLENHPEMLKKIIESLETIAAKEFPKAPDEVTIKNPVTKIEVANMIKSIMVSNFPEAFKISNLKDLKIPKMPEIIRVKNPRFAVMVKELGFMSACFKKVSDAIIKQEKEGIFIKNRETSEAIPVVLTTADRKSFYTAMFQALGAASGTTTDELKKLLAELVSHGTNGSGRLAVTTAGTAEELTTTTACRKVWITCLPDNTSSLVVVGNSDVVAAEGTRQGITIFKNNTFGPFYINDLAKMFVDVLTNGDGVSYYYEV